MLAFIKKHWKIFTVIWGILAVINITTDVISERNKVHYIPERYRVEPDRDEACLYATSHYLGAKWERMTNTTPSRRILYDYYEGLKQQKERYCNDKQ